LIGIGIVLNDNDLREIFIDLLKKKMVLVNFHIFGWFFSLLDCYIWGVILTGCSGLTHLKF